MGKIEFMITNLPPAIKKLITFLQINKMSLDINGSTILGFTGEEGARSFTPDLLINDEFAFNPFGGALITSAVPATHTSLFVSTLNRPNDEFDQLTSSRVYEQCILDWHDDPRVKDTDAFRTRKIEEFNGDVAPLDRDWETHH